MSGARRRRLAGALAAPAVTALVLTGCGADRTSPPGPGAPASSGVQRPPGAAPAEPPATTVPRRRPYDDGVVERTFTDPTRNRTLRTRIHYPATGAGEATPPAHGSFPLVVFAHGYRLPPDGYERILGTLAEAGYVVAAPDFPHTTGRGGDGLRSDIVNQPADLSFVTDQVIRLAAGGGLPIPGIEQPERIAAVGHSDGGLTVSAFAFNTRYRDPRVGAAVVLTGGRDLFDGSYFPPGSPPLLAVHGTADGNPYSASTGLFRDVPAGVPAFLLTIDGGSHIEPYMWGTARQDVADVIAAFIDAELRGDPSGTERMQAAAASPGLHLDSR